jgi:DNA-binding phage protein
MDFELLAAELLRALRGRRSQAAFARRLKYKSNVAYLWEARRAFPTFAKTLEIARLGRVEPREALIQFYGVERAPSWLNERSRDAHALSPSLLADLRGGMALSDLARRTGFSRFAIARWLDGRGEPRLPQALALIEACTLRVLDFIAVLVDPKNLPSFASAYASMVAARRAAYDLPFSQIVLRTLELEDYARLPAHRTGFIAERLGISIEDEQMYLDALVAAGQARSDGARYTPTAIQTVDTRNEVRRAASVRNFFSRLASERAAQSAQGTSGYNVFAVSQADYRRIVELQRNYFAQLRTIVAGSTPTQVVALASTHLLILSEEHTTD